MSKLVDCPHCKSVIEVDDNLIGYRIKCPNCKQEIVAIASDKNDLQNSLELSQLNVIKEIRDLMKTLVIWIVWIPVILTIISVVFYILHNILEIF